MPAVLPAAREPSTVPSAMSPTWQTTSASSCVDAVGDGGRPAGAVDRPVVRVGDDRDAQAVQPVAESGDPDVDGRVRGTRIARSGPTRAAPTTTATTAPATTRDLRRNIDTDDEQRQPEYLSRHRPEEQHPDDAEQRVTGRRGQVQMPAAMSPRHRNGQGDECDGEPDRSENHHACRPVRARRKQRPPRHPVQEQHDREYHGQAAPSAPRARVGRGFHPGGGSV